MSRIGKVAIPVPGGVKVSISPAMVVSVKGPRGESVLDTKGNVKVREEDGKIRVERHGDDRADRAYHGLYHRLLTGLLVGVTEGYTRELKLQGVGYRAEMKGPEVHLSVGRSHTVRHLANPAVKITVPAPDKIVITGIDKQAVGQEAAKIRSYAKPEPYKGKGIHYAGERVRRKVGKTGAK